MKKIIWMAIGVIVMGIILWIAFKSKPGGEEAKVIPTQGDQATVPAPLTQPEAIKKSSAPVTSGIVNKVELKLVETIKLPEGVKDVILYEETGKPMIFIKTDVIQFLDGDMKVKKEYKLPCPLDKPNTEGCWSKVTFSKGNQYIGVNTIKKYQSETVEDGEFVMLDRDGREMWRKKHNFFGIIPSPNGEYFLGFHDASCGDCSGVIMNQSDNKREFTSTLSARIEFSNKDKDFLLATGDFSETRGYIAKYKENGDFEWRQSLQKLGLNQEASCSEITLSNNEDLMCISCWSATDSINKAALFVLRTSDGSVAWQKEDNKMARSIYKFSSNDDSILVALKSNVLLLTSRNGKELWNYYDEGADFRNLLSISDLDLLIAYSAVYKGKRGENSIFNNYFYFFDKSGRMLLKKDISNFEDKFIGKISILPDKQSLIIKAENISKIDSGLIYGNTYKKFDLKEVSIP